MKKKASSKSKPSKAAKPKGRQAAKPAKAKQPAKPAPPAKARPAQAAAKAKPAGRKAKPAAKPAPRAAASKPVAAAKRPKAAAKPAPSRQPDTDTEVTLAPELIAKTIPESVPAEDEGALKNVMASLTSIFGGRDFLSDAELDAFLDSKMASGEIPPSAALDPLDEAQSLIYEAWNSDVIQRVRLARRALELSEDCADAYVILAENDAKDRKQALELFRKGMEAGQRALDPEMFRRSVGRFWEVMETRPYMRARLGLAECLWEIGKKDEAVGHLRDLMRLNPSDNQGVRYILAQCLLETGADEELGTLLDRFRDDGSPQIRYSRALWMFRHAGPGRQADAVLAEAVKSNPYVPAYLLKRKKLPKEAPDHAEAGSEEEAAAYAMGAAESWQKTLGATDWLAEKVR